MTDAAHTAQDWLAGASEDPSRPAGARRAPWVRLLPFILIGVVLGVWSGLAANSAYRTLSEARLASKGEILAAAVDRRLLAIETALRGLATSEAMVAPKPDLGGLARAALAIVDRFGGWIVLAEVDEGFRTVFETPVDPDSHPVKAALEDRDDRLRAAAERARATGEAELVDLFRMPGAGQPQAAVVVPVSSGSNSRWVLAYGFDPSELSHALAEEAPDEAIGQVVLDGNLRIAADSLADDVIAKGFPDWVHDAVAARDEGLLSGRALSHTDVTVWFTRLDRFPSWRVAVGQPTALTGVASQGFLLGLAVSLVFVAGATLAVLYQDRAVSTRGLEALKTGRRQIARLHQGLPAVLFAAKLTADGGVQVTYVGGNIERVTGWPASTLAKPGGWEARTAPDTDTLERFLNRLRTEPKATADWRMRQPDGSWAWMRTDARRIAAGDGGALEAVGYVTNTTAQHVARGRAHATARLASVGEMAAGIAHELRQPLTTIQLAARNARVALDQQQPERVDRRFRVIVDQAKRAASTIEHLQQFGESGEIDPARTGPLAVREAIEGALALVGAGLSDAGIPLEVATGTPEPVVHAQKLPLEQVLINLLLNARDAIREAPAGEHAITIRAAIVEDEVELSVSDTGGGIPDNLLPDLFEPFVTTKSAEHGTGLGLSISHNIVAAFGGRIAAENTARGARFVVRLPRAAPESG